jgi:hypothetical protein
MQQGYRELQSTEPKKISRADKIFSVSSGISSNYQVFQCAEVRECGNNCHRKKSGSGDNCRQCRRDRVHLNAQNRGGTRG